MLSYDRLSKNGKIGMINMQSWMFIKTYLSIRQMVISQMIIDSMLHLGPRLFDEIGGEVVKTVSFVLTRNSDLSHIGSYIKLSEGNNCEEKRLLFVRNTKKIYLIPQKNFFFFF